LVTKFLFRIFLSLSQVLYIKLDIIGLKLIGEKELNNKLKTAITAITLTILLAMPTIITLANAQEYFGPVKTFAYVGAYPTPIGVGQSALVTYRVDQPGAGLNVRTGGFNGSSVTITRPDGTTETKSDLKMDSTSSGFFTYTPDQVGTYTFVMNFPDQRYDTQSSPGGFQPIAGLVWYAASTSASYELVVQEDPIPNYGRSPPLPTEPWMRPINAENKGWGPLAGNWLMIGYDQTSRSFAGNPAFAPYTSGAKSPHVLWTKKIIPGGLVGGNMGDTVFYHGISYEQHFDPIVVDGIVMYLEHGLLDTDASSDLGMRFLNLYTGEDYEGMYMPDKEINFASITDINTPNEHGAIPLLWDTGSTYYAYELIPNNREPQLKLTVTGMGGGITGYTTMHPENGDLVSYQIGGNSTHRYLWMFNMTRALHGIRAGSITFDPRGTINATRELDEGPGAVRSENYDLAYSRSNSKHMGIEWNVSLPDVFGSQGEILVDPEGGLLIANALDTSVHPFVHWDTAYDIGAITKDSAGRYPSSINHLWTKGFTFINDVHNRRSENLRDGYYVRFDEGEEVVYCIDARTGNLRWQSEPWGNAWGMFTRIYLSAYNTITTSGFDGHVRNYDADTGELRWDFYKGSAGFETAYGSYPEYAGLTIADGTVYCTADEHSSDGVLWRGAQMWAINVESGELEWQINGMYRHPIVVDGIVMALNTYDGRVYAFGKGPSDTTVSAPQVQVTQGEAVVITGTVTDQTPQQAGTPAISDDSMGLWMEYLHMQKTAPMDATGVPVTIDVIDSNGNYYTIGTPTSDANGKYSLVWTPEISGEFYILASFAGSNSYGSSYDTTTMFVAEPPEATPPPEPTPAPMTDTYIAGSSIAIIAAIVIIGLLILRKK
jgi:hypothetical protein